MVAERPFRSTLDVAVEAKLRRLAVEVMASAQRVSDAMISRADLLASLLGSERQETSSSSQSLNDDRLDATPGRRRDSGRTRSESENEQLNLKEYVDLMKVQMRNDLIKDFTDPLNRRIDDLMAQHHGLSQRVDQLEGCQQVIVGEARHSQDMVKAMNALHEAAQREICSPWEQACRNDLSKLDTAGDACDAHNLVKSIGVFETNMEKYIDRTVDVPVVTQGQVLPSQPVQKTVEVPQIQFLDRMDGVPAVMQRQTPQCRVPRAVSQDRIPQRIEEQLVDIPVPQIAEETVDVFDVFTQERVQQRIVEQSTETPAISFADEIAETPKTQTQNDIICRLKEDQSEFLEVEVQETVEVPQIQFIDKTLDVPVVMQRQVPTVQKVQKTVEVPQTQFIDKVVDVPVHMQRRAPEDRDAQKAVACAQVQFLDKIADVPVVAQHWMPVAMQREIPMGKRVQRRIEAPSIMQAAGMMPEVPQIRDQTVEVARVIPQERIKLARESASVRERIRQFEMNGVSRTSTVEVPRATPSDRQSEDPEDEAPNKRRKQESDPDSRAPVHFSLCDGSSDQGTKSVDDSAELETRVTGECEGELSCEARRHLV